MEKRASFASQIRTGKRPLRSDLAGRFGQWAVVTGATDGMGREVAQLLAQSGLNLVLVARRKPVLDELARRFGNDHGVEVRVLALDMARDDHVAQLIAGTEELDVGLLIAAAGFGSSGRFLDGEISNELDMIDVNCRTVLALSHAFGNRFARRGRGGLVLFGSLVGWQGVPFSANYSASKAYVQSLAEALRVELAPAGVDVLCVAAGPVASGFARRARMTMSASTSSSAAADAIVRALCRRGTIVPGLFGKMLTYSLALLPRALRILIMSRVMQGMADRHEEQARKIPRPA